MKKITILKIGGELLNDKKSAESLFSAISQMISEGQKIVIVHGGGAQVDDVCNKLGIKIKKVNGRRITDGMTLEIIKMVFGGLINTDLVALAIKNKINAFGFTGISGNLVSVSKRPPKMIVDQQTGVLKEVNFGYVGDIKNINIKMLENLIELDFVPIVACLGIGTEGQVFNVNADTLATGIASALKADKLIFVSDVRGVIENQNVLKSITVGQAKEMIKTKKITDGMIPKIENVETALSMGVSHVQILGCLKNKNDWLNAINNFSFGTVITGGKL